MAKCHTYVGYPGSQIPQQESVLKSIPGVLKSVPKCVLKGLKLFTTVYKRFLEFVIVSGL